MTFGPGPLFQRVCFFFWDAGPLFYLVSNSFCALLLPPSMSSPSRSPASSPPCRHGARSIDLLSGVFFYISNHATLFIPLYSPPSIVKGGGSQVTDFRPSSDYEPDKRKEKRRVERFLQCRPVDVVTWQVVHLLWPLDGLDWLDLVEVGRRWRPRRRLVSLTDKTRRENSAVWNGKETDNEPMRVGCWSDSAQRNTRPFQTGLFDIKRSTS